MRTILALKEKSCVHSALYASISRNNSSPNPTFGSFSPKNYSKVSFRRSLRVNFCARAAGTPLTSLRSTRKRELFHQLLQMRPIWRSPSSDRVEDDTSALSSGQTRYFSQCLCSSVAITRGNFTLLLADYESCRAVNVDAIYLPPDLPRSPVGSPVERIGLVYLSGRELALNDCSVVV
jgi:hypothetical protein